MANTQSRLPINAEIIAEFIFLALMIFMIAGPLSGFILSTQTWISAIFTKSAAGVESTKNLAKQVIESTDRIKTLEARLAQSQIEMTELKQEARDTNNLRALLNLKQKSKRKTVAADVIGRSPDNWFNQITLDRGSNDGIHKGSAVITSDGVVGQVVSVSDSASVVRLLTDPDQKLGVVIQRLGVSGILSGDYQKPAKIDFVPLGTNVDIGDKILCMGKGGVFPENHPVGKVVGVRRDTGGASLEIEVKLAENCYDLSQVLVVPTEADNE